MVSNERRELGVAWKALGKAQTRELAAKRVYQRTVDETNVACLRYQFAQRNLPMTGQGGARLEDPLRSPVVLMAPPYVRGEDIDGLQRMRQDRGGT